MSPLRWTLVALLVASAALFAVGVIAERSNTDEHSEPAGAHVGESGESAGGPAGAHEEGEGVRAGEERHAETAAGETPAGENETLFGVDVESTPLIVLAVIAGLALAALAASRFGRLRVVLLAVAVIALAWAALDVREVVHQLDESHTGIAIITIAVAVLHLAAALVAGTMGMRTRRVDGGSPARRGTIPA